VLIRLVCYLWLIDVVFAYIAITHNFDKLKTWIIYMIIGIIPILLLILMSKISVNGKNSTNTEHNVFNYSFGSKVTRNIRSWINSILHKIFEIYHGLNICKQVTECDNSPDNHSLHNGSIIKRLPTKKE